MQSRGVRVSNVESPAAIPQSYGPVDHFESELYLFEYYGYELIVTVPGTPMNEMALVELFWNVHRRIARRLSPLARGKGLSASELVVLWKAHRLGQCRVTVLAEDLGVAPSTLTGMLDRLVKSNWLQRGRDPDDRRAVILKTTPALDELVRDLRHEGTKSLEKVFRRLPAEVRERLGRDLASVLSCLEQDEEKVSE